jgi:hypothetical protein
MDFKSFITLGPGLIFAGKAGAYLRGLLTGLSKVGSYPFPQTLDYSESEKKWETI